MKNEIKPQVPRLKLTSITKRYGSVCANDGISLQVMPGEILAILGENGAGKSTLMKIIFGTVTPDAGTIEFDGRPVYISGPHAARELGIGMVFQHFVLFDTLSALENILLGMPAGTDPVKLRHRVEEESKHYGLDLDPDAIINDMSMGERQRVEIMRALLTKPKLLILDEPTSVLSPTALKSLFATLKRLTQEGVSIIFITHKLNEIKELSDTCTVIRNGKVVATVNPHELSETELAKLMVGDKLPSIQPREDVPTGDGLRIDLPGIKIDLKSQFALKGKINVPGGRIVGVAGISGNGQADLLKAISGEVLVNKKFIRLLDMYVGDLNVKRRREIGLRYVPEQRLGHAAVPEMSLASNTLLTSNLFLSKGFMRNKMIRRFTDHVIKTFSVKAAGSGAEAMSLSGGNLQKFIVGRELMHNPSVLVLNQPTWGVDIGAAALIRNALIRQREKGSAILVISEEIDELFEICDEIVVMSQGNISPQISTTKISKDEVGRWMGGLWDHESDSQPASIPGGAV